MPQWLTAPRGANRIHFDTLADALAFRGEAGGWVFAPDDEDGAQWFAVPHWTPGPIMLAVARSGRLL